MRCRLVGEAEDASIVIEDEGPGIPEDELPRVTERFFRGRNEAPVGSGLGLSIVELALERSGWRLKLENRSGGGLSAVMSSG